MSSPSRRAEKQAEFEREQAAHRAEVARRARRSMFEKIEEANNKADVREILHELAQKLGLEE